MLLNAAGIPDTGYNSMTQDEAKNMKQAVSALEAKEASQEKEHHLGEKTKKESKFNLRFNLTSKQEKKEEQHGKNVKTNPLLDVVIACIMY